MRAKCGREVAVYQWSSPWRASRSSSRSWSARTAPTEAFPDPQALLEQLAQLPQFAKELAPLQRAQERLQESQARAPTAQERYTQTAKELKSKEEAMQRAVVFAVDDDLFKDVSAYGEEEQKMLR
eukprot:9023499-Pyramimonas_sp.AAC.1